MSGAREFETLVAPYEDFPYAPHRLPSDELGYIRERWRMNMNRRSAETPWLYPTDWDDIRDLLRHIAALEAAK